MDIQGILAPGGEPEHRIGHLVFQSGKDKSFAVIDGQKCLTTLARITLAVLKNLQRLVEAKQDPVRNAQHLEQIRQSHIVPLGLLPVPGFRASKHALRAAFEWFDREAAHQNWMAHHATALWRIDTPQELP